MIVIHIGLRKSGSTSLQYFLSDNEEALRRIGVEYPRLGRSGRLTQTAHQNLQCELRGRKAIFDPARGTIADVANYWREARAHTLILSCEGFEECPTDEARRLKTLARDDEEFRIVLIVRDLVSLMPSSYGQKIKSGTSYLDFDAFFDRRMQEPRVDYFRTAENWAAAFGWEALRVRLLDPAHLLNGDLIDDFLALADIDPEAPITRSMARPGIVNVTPGWRVLEALRALYGGWHGLGGDHVLAGAADHDRDLRQDVGFCAIEVGEAMGWNADRGRYLTREQARACLNVYAKSLAAINRRAGDTVPMPADLVARGFEPRRRLLHSSLIKPERLRVFYDKVGRRLARRQADQVG
jgi:hypothetical protein